MSSEISSSNRPADGMSLKDVTNCESVREAVKELVTSSEGEKHFFICDLADVITKTMIWKENLPRVRPFYAVKTNPDHLVMRLMVSLGLGFDCGSKAEMELALSVGANPSDIIYTCTQKPISHLCYAAEKQIGLMTFDCEEELRKIKKHYRNSKLLLRFKTPNDKAVYELSVKFGCTIGDAGSLLVTAKSLAMNVVGVAFHVGGLCVEPSAYTGAVASAQLLFDKAAQLGFSFNVLDIGGGFPGHKGSYKLYTEMCRFISGDLEKHFANSTARILAEVGNYFVNSAYTLCTTIIGRKNVLSRSINGRCQDEINTVHYYINDGTYGSVKSDWMLFGGRMLFLTKHGKYVNKPGKLSKIWGYSACGKDFVTDLVSAPELDVGDHVVIENMGAYMLSMSCCFNGYIRPQIYYTYSEMSIKDDFRNALTEKLPRDWQSIMKQNRIGKQFLLGQ